MSAKVYFAPLADGSDPQAQANALMKTYVACDTDQMIGRQDFVAIKIHVGEKNNTTHVSPVLMRALGQAVSQSGGQPFLTETSTLYRGERENAVKHLLHAHRHGFSIENTGMPFIMADGLTGNAETEVSISGELHQKVKVAREILAADVLLVVSHPTGHVAAGIGACIKNLGMGLASRQGKMRQHSAMQPQIDSEKCVLCHKCMVWCPEDTIVEKDGRAFIQTENCIGCGECLAVCRFDAVKYNWNMESDALQCHMAEHAMGVSAYFTNKAVYFNVLVNMTKECDCFDIDQKKCIPDMGILASRDPVAVDMATMELVASRYGQDLGAISHAHLDGMIQIRHAAKIGMGQLEYELIQV